MNYEEEYYKLAAHVESCHRIMRMVDEGPEFVSARARRGIRLLRERKPVTSLARHIAEKQAEAMEEQVKKNQCARREIAAVAAGLRRQAEEGES